MTSDPGLMPEALEVKPVKPFENYTLSWHIILPYIQSRILMVRESIGSILLYSPMPEKPRLAWPIAPFHIYTSSQHVAHQIKGFDGQ